MGIQPNYSILDAAATGPSLEIQESGLVVTSNIPNATVARKIRARLPKTSGVWCFEVGYWTKGAVSPANLVSMGICTALSTLNTGTGVDGSSYGYRAPTGGLYNNNTLVAACNATAEKTYIGFVADLDNSTLSIYSDGGLILTQAISPAGGSPVRMYYPCFTVGSGAEAYSIFQFVNFGQRAFAYPYPGATGWFAAARSPGARYLGPIGTTAYSSGALDSPANQAYEAAVLNADDFEVDAGGSVYLWKDRNDGSTYSFLDIDNVLNRHGNLLTAGYRDQPVYVRQLNGPNKTLAAGSAIVATAFVDRVEPGEAEKTIRVYLKGKLSTLQGSLQRRIHPPWMDPGVAGRPMQIIAGAARSVDVGAFLTDEAARHYQLADEQISNIGVLRDKGNPLNPSATPPQYQKTSDMQGVILETLPEGKLTGDISSEGPQASYPGVPDVLLGTGSDWDTTWVGPSAPPPGWVLTNTDNPLLSSSAIKQGSVQGFAHEMIAMSSKRTVSAIGGTEFSLRSANRILRAGKKYRIRFTMWDYQAGGANVGGGLCVMSAQASYLNGGQWISEYLTPLRGGFHSEIPFQLVYEVPAGLDRYLYFTVVGVLGQECKCTFRNIVVEELAESIVDVPLLGIGFRGYMDKIITRLCGLDPSEWSGADCDALDAAYPGSPLGVAISEAVTKESAIRLPMDSICGTVIEDRLGVLRFKRLVDPRTATPVATYTNNEIEYPVSEWPDYAEGLTQTVGNQRNWSPSTDSDFVSDYTLVPAALRTQLKRKSRIIQQCGLQLRNDFQFAAMAGPLDTVFEDSEIAIAEIERINRPFSYDRPGGLAPGFILFTINYDGLPPEHLFGDVLAIDYVSPAGFAPRYIQRQVAVLRAKYRLGRQQIQILGWG